ncbi:MAG TPA: TonB-dependent receptor [Candidatus Dormibacteraeota bacterium]|nr:TonB-dependent receptor [Candidatus Dormibacteraeota bacterium]
MMAHPPRLRTILGLVAAGATLLLCILCAGPLQGQVVGGSISGTITDNSGAVVANATVSMKDLATGFVTSVKTNAQGFYSVPNLLPGTYQQAVSAAGFETAVRNGVILTVGAQMASNIAMKVGAINETVEVRDQPADLQLESSAISSSTDSRTIVELPLNARSWTDLAQLQPGVNTIRAMAAVSSTDRLGRGYGVELSVSGGRPQQNNYLLDGVSINDYTNQAPGSILGGNLGVDAVSEFSVLTSNQGAEYGRTSGGVISAITRTGTNRFHGSAYEFLRNSALDARNYFDPPAIAPFRRNQFGVAAGGPIQKDKTFIFGDYEGLRQSLGLSMVDNVPSLTARSGMICNAPDCTSFTNVGVDPLVAPYLGFYPKPNGAVICPFQDSNGNSLCPAGVGDTAIYSFSGSAITTENYFTTRVDHRFSDKDNLAGSYMYDNSPSSQNDEFNNKLIFTKTRRQLVSLEENHVFRSALMNSFRVGYHREYAAAPSGSKAINPMAADTSLGYVPGDTVGFIGVPGLTFFTGGLSTQTPAEYNWNSWQVYDNVFLTKGIHSLKFGGNVERIIDNQSTPSQPGGDFEFSSLADFLTNNNVSPTDSLTLIADAPGIVSRRRVRETIFGLYLQDDMRVRANLTLNLGLRYEIATVPSETHGHLASLQNLTDAAVIVRSPLFSNATLHNFEPRIGFAWDPFGNAKTAIRGGFGMFDVLALPANLRHTVDGTVPFYASVNGPVPAGSFGPFALTPQPAYTTLSAGGTAQRAAFIDQHPKRNYVMQWNLNIQRAFGSNTTGMIAYVGSRSVHNLMQTDDSSIVLPVAKTPEGYLWPCTSSAFDSQCTAGGQLQQPSGGPVTLVLNPTLNPAFGRVPATFWNSDGIYHALEVQVQKRMSHGLSGQVSYTWGRTIDTASGSTDGDQFKNGLSSQFFFDSRLRRGPSDFNQTHNVVFSYNWEIPSPKALPSVLNWITGGWEFGGIINASTGVPFTVTIAPDSLGLNNTDAFNFPDIVHGCNPVHGGINYVNLNCFTLPQATPDIAAQCQPFGFVSAALGPPGNPGIPGTCANLLGNSRRNNIVGPSLVNLDMSLFKNNYVRRISEQFNVQFRMEVFNILNHANFNPPTSNSQVFDGSGNPVGGAGLLDTTATTSRQVQFALKVIW